MPNRTSLKTTIIILSQMISHTLHQLSFWLICAKPLSLILNHQCNDVSIYLISTCLRRAMSRCYKLLVRSPEAKHSLTLHNRAWIYGQGFTSFLRVQLQQSTTGSGFQLGPAPLKPVLSVCNLSCDFSASFFLCPLFAAVVSTERFFFTQ